MRKVCWWGRGLLLGLSLLLGGCGDFMTLFLNQTASLGGGSDAIPLGGAGAQGSPRGEVRVLFINNTPFRAVFSAGAYDQSSRHSSIDLVQFAAEDDGNNLEPDSTSGTGTLNCARQIGLGSPDLLRLIADLFNVQPLVNSAVVEGVQFFEISEGAAPVNRGMAPPRVVNIGTEFRCESLLIFRLEIDDVGPAPFRIELDVVPSESTRP